MSTTDNQSKLGYLLVGGGILLLLNQWFGFINLGGVLWPLFVIVPGALFLYAASKGDENQAGMVFPGAIITGTGLILLYQSLTGHWASWAYIWALYPGLVGLALQYHGQRRGSDKEITTGREMTRWSGIAFVIGYVFFELIIFSNFGGLAWLLLIVGAFVLLQQRNGVYFPKHKHHYNGHSNGTKRKHEEEQQYV